MLLTTTFIELFLMLHNFVLFVCRLSNVHCLLALANKRHHNLYSPVSGRKNS